MHYLAQSVSIALTISIFVVWNIHKKLETYSDKLFLMVVLSALLSEILDILCQFSISPEISFISNTLTTFFINAYYVSILLYMLFVALYILRLIYNLETYLSFRKVLFIVFILLSILMVALPVDFIYYSNCSILGGVGMSVLYIVCYLSCLLLIVILIKERKKISLWIYVICIFWILLFVSGLLVNYLFVKETRVPTISIGIAVGSMLLYLSIESPGSKYDYDDNCFYYGAFIGYVKEVIESRRNESCMIINFKTKNASDSKPLNDIKKQLFTSPLYDKSFKTFKRLANELIIVTNDVDRLNTVADSLLGIIETIEKENVNHISITACVYIIPNLSKLKSYNIFASILSSTIHNNFYVKEKVLIKTINNDDIQEFENEYNTANILSDAIRKKRFEIVYQKIDYEESDLVYSEASANVITEDQRVLSYNDYCDIAEKYEMFKEIDMIVLQNVCKTLEEINRNDNTLGSILVRINAQTLESESFRETFKHIICNSNLPLNKLCFEVTDASAILQNENLLSIITELQKLGVSFAIDGFGSGDTNLNCFIDIPMSIVKLDKLILKNASKDDKAAVITKDITDLAHALDFKVVAVGAGSEDDKSFIKKCGIEMNLDTCIFPVINEEEFISDVSSKEDK